jgi:hypothetical protein
MAFPIIILVIMITEPAPNLTPEAQAPKVEASSDLDFDLPESSQKPTALTKSAQSASSRIP